MKIVVRTNATYTMLKHNKNLYIAEISSNKEVFLFILFDKIFRESGIFLIGTVQIECNQSRQYQQQGDQSQVYHQTSIGSLEHAYDG